MSKIWNQSLIIFTSLLIIIMPFIFIITNLYVNEILDLFSYILLMGSILFFSIFILSYFRSQYYYYNIEGYIFMGGLKFPTLSNTQDFDLREINEMLIAGQSDLKTSNQLWGRYLTLKSNHGNVFLYVPNNVLKKMIKAVPKEKVKFLHFNEVKKGV